MSAHTPTVLSIAGSDSGGGAGIQADLKAFARCGVHGACAVTAVTAQNTLGVSAIHTIPPELVRAQIDAVLGDIGVDAVKIGMLGTAAIAHAVAEALEGVPAGTPVVVDPVMVAESGARLLEHEAEGALVAEIVPRATVLTPNIPEARVLAGQAGARRVSAGAEAAATGAADAPQEDAQGEAREAHEIEQLARAVLALGADSVVVTGGHRRRAADVFVDRGGGSAVVIEGERHPGGAAHGSGCTHSSVLAAQLALGSSPLDAARRARELAGEAVAHGLRDVGAGAGPVDVLGLGRMREA